jgi:hypothetical protein
MVLLLDGRANIAPKPNSKAMTFHAQILTLYPEMFPGPLGVSLAGRALAEGKWSCTPIQIRDFATDKHRTVDDTPAGGGAGTGGGAPKGRRGARRKPSVAPPLPLVAAPPSLRATSPLPGRNSAPPSLLSPRAAPRSPSRASANSPKAPASRSFVVGSRALMNACSMPIRRSNRSASAISSSRAESLPR